MKMIGNLIERIFLQMAAKRVRLRGLFLTATALLVGVCFATAANAGPKYEIPPQCKEDPTRLVEVIFDGDYRVRMRNYAPTAVGRKQFGERSRETLRQLSNGTWFVMHRLGETDVDKLVERARRASPQIEVPDLNNSFVFLVPADRCLKETVRELRAIPEIHFAYPQPRFVPAASNDYTQFWEYDAYGLEKPYQAYLHDESLGGLSVFEARGQFSGADGREVNILVHESEANIFHEALFYNVEYSPTYFPDVSDLRLLHHGTQTLGMLAAKPDELTGTGILGIADGATTYFVQTGSHVGYSILVYQSIALGVCDNPANASSVCNTLPGEISHAYATGNLESGDILLIEKQMCPMFGPNSHCQTAGNQLGMTPVEWSPAMWDIIRALTALNIVVVEPAGNGSVDLDAPAYNELGDNDYHWATPHYPFKVAGGMPVKDSGALIVGASTSGTDWGTGHFDIASSTFTKFPEGIPRYYSNHGKRVDLRAWGEAVVTTGTTVSVDEYGIVNAANLANETGTNVDYTFAYGGTSSASPMIAGAAAALQGIRIQALSNWASGERLSPLRIRNLLRTTGTTFSIDSVSAVERGRIMASQELNPDAILGPRPNIVRAAQGVGRHPDEYCYMAVPAPRFALEDRDGDGLVSLNESDLRGTSNKYFSFRPIVPNVPPGDSFIAWSSDGSEPTCLYPGAATCTTPWSAQNNQHVYTDAQDGSDYSGIGIYREDYGNPDLLTLPITIKAKTTVVTNSCGVRTSETVEITYALN